MLFNYTRISKVITLSRELVCESGLVGFWGHFYFGQCLCSLLLNCTFMFPSGGSSLGLKICFKIAQWKMEEDSGDFGLLMSSVFSECCFVTLVALCLWGFIFKRWKIISPAFKELNSSYSSSVSLCCVRLQLFCIASSNACVAYITFGYLHRSCTWAFVLFCFFPACSLFFTVFCMVHVASLKCDSDMDLFSILFYSGQVQGR